MQVWNVLHAARWKCRTQNIAKNSSSGHHRTTLSGYIFAIKARVDNRKKNLQHLFHMSAQYGELRLTSGWHPLVCLGHPANLNGFRILAALLHSTLGVGVSQTLPLWAESATYIRQGGHRVGHCPHSSCLYFYVISISYLSIFFLWPPCGPDADIIFMVALCNRADHYILPWDFYILSFFLLLFSSPNLRRYIIITDIYDRPA